MNNTRFATVLHILSLLAKSPGQWLSSDWIAGSINLHPVIVRKELSVLQQQGWVISRKGKEGGSRLLIAASAIPLAAIYQVVKNTAILGKKNPKPNPKCPVGRQINSKLDALFLETDQILLDMLSKKSLQDFAGDFK